MNLKEKKQELFEKVNCSVPKYEALSDNDIQELMIVIVKDRYFHLRELLFNLKSSGFQISEKVYLKRIQDLIDEEEELIKEIEKI